MDVCRRLVVNGAYINCSGSWQIVDFVHMCVIDEAEKVVLKNHRLCICGVCEGKKKSLHAETVQCYLFYGLVYYGGFD